MSKTDFCTIYFMKILFKKKVTNPIKNGRLLQKNILWKMALYFFMRHKYPHYKLYGEFITFKKNPMKLFVVSYITKNLLIHSIKKSQRLWLVRCRLRYIGNY